MLAKRLMGSLVGLAAAALVSLGVNAAEPVKIGLIEPFSGPIAAVGRDTLEGFELLAEMINESGGVLDGREVEIVPLDNAMNAEKTIQQLKKAIDMGLRYVSQGVGSNHALNIIKFLKKHNKRNPDKAILYLNHSAVTTAFTNELCSYWHFRFDANVDMKVAALATQIGRDTSIKKVYMINQNYAYGKSFQSAAQRLLKERAPAVEMVGDELIVPFGKVLDFTPYVAKVKDSGADTVLTGNWGPDLVRFVKAAASSGLGVQFYTIYGGLPGSIAGIGKDDGTAVVFKQLTEIHENMDLPPDLAAFAEEYRKRYDKSVYSDRIRWMMLMFAAAIDKAGTDDPSSVAAALEGITFAGPGGEVLMRPDDHQIQMPMVISTMTDQVEKTVLYDGVDLGVGWKTDGWTSREEAEQPTSCSMDRPAT
ncbi:MAG: branched-chain amino acid ABC transporter substrate-binding protein [Alphaproteobacteria bacterium]|jgi:branched-chain amino acid transport system substrate-binding protein|nr:branched-chain amino acid ABC transporter substrate-binding protein [Alphaproteobacteria bacterium]